MVTARYLGDAIGLYAFVEGRMDLAHQSVIEWASANDKQVTAPNRLLDSLSRDRTKSPVTQ